MYTQLKKKGLGGFSDNNWYWSSSERSNVNAWDQSFSAGGQYDGDAKDLTGSVRAVRAF
jgi:hypothetical protein